MTRFVVLGCCVFLSLLLLPCPLCVGRIAAIDTISFLLNHLCAHTYIGYILCFAFIPLSIIVKKKKKMPPLTRPINHGTFLKMKISSSNTSILNLQISLTNKSILTVWKKKKKTARSRRGRRQAILGVSVRAWRSECLQVRAKDIRRHQAAAVTLNGHSVLSPSRNDLLNDLIDAESPPLTTTDAERPPLATVSSSWLFVISYFWYRTTASLPPLLERSYHCSDDSLDDRIQYHRDSDTSKTHSPNKDSLHFLFYWH